MRKSILPVILILCVILTSGASAVSVRSNNNGVRVTPAMKIEERLVNCRLTVSSGNSRDDISIKVELYKKESGSYTKLKTWTDSGTGILIFDEDYTNGRETNGTYRMEYSVTVDGSKGIDNVSDYVEKSK